MAVDKPLQEIYSTVRIPVTDSIILADNTNTDTDNESSTGFGVNYGLYWNCYPQFFTDRAQNQYASQFDTWVTKRGPVNAFSIAPIANGTIPTAEVTTTWLNMCISSLNDVYVAVIWNSTTSKIQVIQYRPNAGTSVLIGEVSGASVTDTVYATEVVVANTTSVVFSYMNAGETTTLGYYCTANAAGSTGIFTATTLTLINDADFPANISGIHIRGAFVQLDGYLAIMSKEGGVYNSDLNSITSWNPLGVVLAAAYPDQGVGLTRYRNMLMAFGEDSIEFFTDQGKPPPAGPFGRTDQAFIKFGCPFAKCIISLEDSVYWWAKSSGGRWGLWKIDGGFSPVKVSTLKDDICAAKQAAYPELYMYMDKGKQHIISTIKVSSNLLYNAYTNVVAGSGTGTGTQSSPVSGFVGDPYTDTMSSDLLQGWLCWDLNTGVSWVWSSASLYLAFPLAAQNFSNTITLQAITGNTILWSYDAPRTVVGLANYANKIHQTQSEQNFVNNAWVYKDDAVTGGATPTGITCAVVFNKWDFGNEKRKSIHKLKVINREFGLSGNFTAMPYTWVLYNKQDGNFSRSNASQAEDMKRIYVRPSKKGETTARTYINNLGTARKWCFGIVQKSDMNFAGNGIELDISQRSS